MVEKLIVKWLHALSWVWTWTSLDKWKPQQYRRHRFLFVIVCTSSLSADHGLPIVSRLTHTFGTSYQACQMEMNYSWYSLASCDANILCALHEHCFCLILFLKIAFCFSTEMVSFDSYFQIWFSPGLRLCAEPTQRKYSCKLHCCDSLPMSRISPGGFP